MTTISKTTTTKKVTKTTTTESSCSSPEITITRKGNFFNDSFFEDRRKDYQVAVRDVLSKFGDKTSKSDELTSYRDLRTKDLKEENQAVKSSQDDRSHKIVIDVQDFTPGGEVTVKTVDEKKVVIEGQVQRQEGNTTSSKSFKKIFIFSDAEMDSISSVMSSDGILTVTIPKKEPEMQQIVNIEKKTITQQQTQQSQQSVSNTTSDKKLCITQKGNFFDDSFFEDARKPFQEAVQNVLQKSNESTSQTDQISTYRNLRQRELKEETQAATTSDDQKEHKIIVDVQDFINGGDVVVKTVNDREVVIEGSIKKQEGNKTSSKSFRKQYTLADDIQTDNVTSVVSADGVLTIIAPKKLRAIQPGESNVPLSLEQKDTSKQVVSSNTTNTALQSTNQTTNTQSQVANQDTEQQNVTIQKKVTTVTQQSHVTSDDHGCTSPSDRPLPITKKGDFFNDSFFEDARKPYQEAVRNVLQKSNVNTTQTNEIQSYRDLRQQDLKEETQAATTSDDQNQHKIIVDVQDFINGGEVIVKTVNDRDVVITGSIKKQEGNRTSSKSFRKQFTLADDIQTENVTSVVSADGVLTIIAPKKPRAIQPGVTNVPIQQTDANKQVMTSNTTNTALQSTNQTSNTQSQVDTQQTQQQNVTLQKKVTTVTQQSHVTSDNTGCTSPSDRPLSITKKGDFFNDSFFEDARKPFQEAIRDVLQKSNVSSTQTNEIQSYRDLRQRELKEETQAATVSDDQLQHKIIVDVQDFINGGDVIVKTVDDREVVITGSIKKQEGNKTSSKSFRKQYTLADDIQTENVTSVVSADGVLTIIAPKKVTVPQNREMIVPLTIQQAEGNKQVVASNTSNTAIQTINQQSSNVSQVASQQTQQNISIQKKVTTVKQQTQVSSDSTSHTSSDRSLTITRKGDFFSDSFFEDARKPFQEAIRSVLQKSNVNSTQTDEIASYRNLRQHNLKEETQAATISDDQRQHKIIVDVQDFINGGDVTVKTVEDREVVIAGSIKKQEGNKTSSKSFRKIYILPEDIVSEAVTSVVSADGVMTIIAPKRNM